MELRGVSKSKGGLILGEGPENRSNGGSFRDEGKIPVLREEWIIVVMRRADEGRQALTDTVGRRSSWPVDDLDFFLIIFDTSVMEGSVKLENN